MEDDEEDDVVDVFVPPFCPAGRRLPLLRRLLSAVVAVRVVVVLRDLHRLVDQNTSGGGRRTTDQQDNTRRRAQQQMHGVFVSS